MWLAIAIIDVMVLVLGVALYLVTRLHQRAIVNLADALHAHLQEPSSLLYDHPGRPLSAPPGPETP